MSASTNLILPMLGKSLTRRCLLRLTIEKITEKHGFFGIGFLKNFVVAIVFTEPDEQTIRVISLRRALKYEREYFEDYIANELGEIGNDDGRRN